MRTLSLVICCLMCTPASADLVLSVGNISVTSGSTGNLLGVFASSSTGETLEGFNLTIDFGNNGFGVPAGFAFPGGSLDNSDVVKGPTLANSVTVTGTGALPTPPFTQNYEGVFNGSGEALALSASPTKLFDILVDVTASPGSSIPVSIRLGNVLPQFTAITSAAVYNESFTTGLTLNSGSISVSSASAVPEPSSFVLVAMGLSAAAFRTRRKRVSVETII